MGDLKPTPEQESIIEVAATSKASLMVNAYAGTAKTTSSVMLARRLPMVPTLAVAFNKKIAQQAEKAFPGYFKVSTLNGLGHSAWAKAIGKRPELDDRKLGKIVSGLMKESHYDGGEDSWHNIRSLATAAMQAGLVPSTLPYEGLVPDIGESWQSICSDAWLNPVPQELELARAAVIENIRLAYGMGSANAVISFDDQIYCSTLLGGVYPRFPVVMVDEAQDLSPLNHLQIKKSCADRLIVVGDKLQAIYAFRGADSASMAKLRALRPVWDDRPLTVTFRCPKLVVARVQSHAPGFTAFASNPEGHIQHLEAPAGHPGEWTWGWPDIAQAAADLEASLCRRPEVAILCRNNAPLIKTAFRLLRRGIAPQMLGRDIGKGLAILAKKILPDDDLEMMACITRINDWADREEALALANDQEYKVDGIRDRAESLLAVIQFGHCNQAGDIRRALEKIFSSENGRVTLATGHKAKGLEWDLVVHLDPWRIPSKFATQQAQLFGDMRQLEQEKNLRYVIETRTKHTLLLANAEDFK